MVHNVSVVGAGTMGHALALHFAVHGQNVTLVGHRKENVDRARGRIRDTVATLNELSIVTAVPDSISEAITFTVDARAGVETADVVLESVSEDLDTKHDVFAVIGDAAPSEAVLASNTSGLRIDAIASGVPESADRIVGCHWWNPPYLMPLVEIVQGTETSTDTITRVERFVEAVDREPVHIQRDVPGFVWNRIQFAVLRECMYLVEEGVASLEDVNKAVRDGYALRTAAVGPFETVDLSGLDLFRGIADELYPCLCADETPSRLFDEYVEDGRTGVEAGAGFYEYDESLETRTRDRDERLAAIRAALAGQRER